MNEVNAHIKARRATGKKQEVDGREKPIKTDIARSTSDPWEQVRSNDALLLNNERLANARFGPLSSVAADCLRALTQDFQLSIAIGDISLINGNWYVTHAGLLRVARRNRCSGIETELLAQFCNPITNHWVIKATVYKSHNARGFVGYGDADPSNVSDLVRGAEMRVAETRAVNRALRKAYGIGLCSVEEIGNSVRGTASHKRQGTENGDEPHPARLRDRLLSLIRRYELDAVQVKRFAQAYCGNKPLRQVERQQVEAFIDHLQALLSENKEHARAVLEGYAAAPEASAEAVDHGEADHGEEEAA